MLDIHAELAAYAESDELLEDINAAMSDYVCQGETPPPESEVRLALLDGYRVFLEQARACELLGHNWHEDNADPENGRSTLSCQRCGEEHDLQWL